MSNFLPNKHLPRLESVGETSTVLHLCRVDGGAQPCTAELCMQYPLTRRRCVVGFLLVGVPLLRSHQIVDSGYSVKSE